MCNAQSIFSLQRHNVRGEDACDSEKLNQLLGHPGMGERVLGVDPASGREVQLRHGPYGWYVELAVSIKRQQASPTSIAYVCRAKPKRASLGKRKHPGHTHSLAEALDLLQWSKVVLT